MAGISNFSRLLGWRESWVTFGAVPKAYLCSEFRRHALQLACSLT